MIIVIIIGVIILLAMGKLFSMNKDNELPGSGNTSGNICSEGLRCHTDSDIARVISGFNLPVWTAKFRYPSVPRSWIFAFIAWESGGDSHAFNPADPSAGCMQILDTTFYSLCPNGKFPEDLFNPYTCIRLGTRLIAEDINRYGYNIIECYAHYNGGTNPPWISYDRGKCVEELAKRFKQRLIVP